MKIIVDAFGGDNAPLEIIKGCAEATSELDIDIMLTGDEKDVYKRQVPVRAEQRKNIGA